MKLATQFRGTLVAIEEKSVTGSNGKYYQLAVLQGSEATSLSCTEEVYKQNKELFKDYVFGMQISEYEGKKTLRVTGIYDLPGTATSPICRGSASAAATVICTGTIRTRRSAGIWTERSVRSSGPSRRWSSAEPPCSAAPRRWSGGSRRFFRVPVAA